ncbi:MAG: transposase [Deltaproteobacteria bacterium]|nr:transposase [Deltaproteobacteria bacterium]
MWGASFIPPTISRKTPKSRSGKIPKVVVSFAGNYRYQGEVTRKYQKRFIRYRESLFRFLEEDGIPWNNNMAERAIRHLAVQRKISGTFFKRVAVLYLRLLGIAQSCRFQEKSFLGFLLSEEKEIDQFKERKRPKTSKPIETTQRNGKLPHDQSA